MITTTTAGGSSQKSTEDQIDFYFMIAQAHLEPYNIRLRLKKWRDDKINYQLVDEDPETLGWAEISRPLTKSECYKCLFALSALYARIHKIRFQRYLKAEQERERQLREENSSSSSPSSAASSSLFS